MPSNVQHTMATNVMLAQLPPRERDQVRVWVDIVEQFRRADNKSLALETLNQEYAHLVRFSRGTLYRKVSAYEANGVLGLFPGRVRRMIEEQTPLPPRFIEFWQRLCCDNQRKTAPAFRSLYYDHLTAGRVIPGYETDWAGIFRLQHPGWSAPAACPYEPHSCEPDGWSERNLRRYAPGTYQLVVARQGTAAGREYLPKLPTTRVGLPFGRVFVVDDVEHDAQVTFVGNRSPQGVVELGALELLSAHYCTWGAKPIRERADGTREKLRENYMRYLLADIACRIGFSPDGCLVCGEHGTARLPGDLLETLNRWSGNLFEFAAGGKLNKPMTKGLFLGLRRGNFRFKAALESHHNLKKNDLAALPGQKGADPAHAPEDLVSRQQYHRALMKACIALAERDPQIYEKVRSDFPLYYDYINAVLRIYDRIAQRTHHRIEGYQECGFVRHEWRLHPDDTWKPESLLDELDDSERDAVRALIRANPRDRYRTRLMSPGEAFTYCSANDELMRLPEAAAPQILGPDLGQVLSVDKDSTITVADEYLPGRKYPVAAIVRTPEKTEHALERGSRWMVHLSPFDGTRAYISTPDRAFVGTAPVLVGGTKIDLTATRRNLGIVAKVESAELKRLAPIAEQRLREQTDMHEHNARLLSGRDPLGEQQAAQEQRAALKHFSPADLAGDDAEDSFEPEEAAASFDAHDLL